MANYDFFGEEVDDDFDPFGTSKAVKAPTTDAGTTPEQAAKNQIRFENENARAIANAPGGAVSLAGQFRSKALGSGLKVAAPPPGQWGQFNYARQGQPEKFSANAPNDFFGDLTRLGTYIGTGLANPIGTVLGDYLPETANAALNPVGYGTQAVADEGLDTFLPGGSGVYGNNIIPGVEGTGGDVTLPSDSAFDGLGIPGLGGGRGVGAPVGAAPNVQGLRDEQAAARELGMDVLSGNVGAPNPADRGLQMTELERIQQFLNGPREQRNVLADVDEFLAQPHGPSAAEIQLRQAQDDAMSDALSLARGARGGAGAVNRALRVAQAENAATQATGARDLALLRAKEEEANRAQVLQGLGLKGELAGGLDQNTLQALGLGAETAGDIRSQGVAERGQTLGFTGDMVGSALGSSTDLTTAAMRDALERTKLGYELTPDQKLLFASLGAGSDLLSLFL